MSCTSSVDSQKSIFQHRRRHSGSLSLGEGDDQIDGFSWKKVLFNSANETCLVRGDSNGDIRGIRVDGGGGGHIGEVEDKRDGLIGRAVTITSLTRSTIHRKDEVEGEVDDRGGGCSSERDSLLTRATDDAATSFGNGYEREGGATDRSRAHTEAFRDLKRPLD